MNTTISDLSAGRALIDAWCVRYANGMPPVTARDKLVTELLALRSPPAGEGEPCETCQGNGEIVTDWDRYRQPHDGDKGDEAVAPCPDCDGTGRLAPPEGARAVGDGWKLVPVEPTEDMYAGTGQTGSQFAGYMPFRDFVWCWRTALAASPSPAPVAETVSGHSPKLKAGLERAVAGIQSRPPELRGSFKSDKPVKVEPPVADGVGEEWFQNVDAWGAAEWFDRLAKAIRAQDAAVVAGDAINREMYQHVAASSAMRLVRDYEHIVRAALSIGTKADDEGWQELNINSVVKAKLRPEAVEVLRAAHKALWAGQELYPFTPPKVDDDGWSTFQLWSFMQDFGAHISLGRIPPFETTLLVRNRDLRLAPPARTKE